MIEWVLALKVDDLPAPPFKVTHGVAANGHPAGITIHDPEKYLGHLRMEIGWGEDGPRWRNGALEAEVSRLKAWLERQEEYNPFK